MVFLGILHIITLVISRTGFWKLSSSEVSIPKLLQYFTFVYIILGKFFGLLPVGDLTNIYLLSVFIIPVFEKSYKHHEGYYLYFALTSIFLAIALKASLLTVLFSLSFLIFTLSILNKDLALFLVSILSLVNFALKKFGLEQISEITANAFMLALPFGFYFHNKATEGIRYLLLPLFFIYALLLGEPLSIVYIALVVCLYLLVLFVNYSNPKQDIFIYSFLYFLIFKGVEPVNLMGVYFVFFGSIEILKLVFMEFSKINFGEGKIEISYQNMLFFIFSIYLFSGTIYTPMTLAFGKIGNVERLIFFGLWIMCVAKSLLIVKVTERTLSNKLGHLAIFLTPLLLSLINDDFFVMFNAYALLGFFLTISFALLSKKRLDTFKFMRDITHRVRYYPSVQEVLSHKQKLPVNTLNNLKIRGTFLELKLSFPITVGLLFLLWSLASLSFIEV